MVKILPMGLKNTAKTAKAKLSSEIAASIALFGEETAKYRL